MKRKLFAACPRCGMRIEIMKTVWDWDNDQNIALVKCRCTGKLMQVPYAESRVMKVDLANPCMHEENNHFDLLLPPGWTEDMWNRLHVFLTKW